MTEELKLSGKSDFKGRNGYVKLDRVSVMEIPAHSEVHIDFHSTSPNFIGAARLQLTREDFLSFKDWVARLECKE